MKGSVILSVISILVMGAGLAFMVGARRPTMSAQTCAPTPPTRGYPVQLPGFIAHNAEDAKDFLKGSSSGDPIATDMRKAADDEFNNPINRALRGEP